MSFIAGPNGFGVHRWNGTGFDTIGGGLMRIAQNPVTGVLTGVNVQGQIWQSKRGDGSDWTQLPGAGVDVCDGPSGLIVVGVDPA